jgi:hypothetical protein
MSARTSSTAVCNGLEEVVEVKVILPSAVRMEAGTPWELGLVYFCQMRLSAVSEARRVWVLKAP